MKQAQLFLKVIAAGLVATPNLAQQSDIDLGGTWESIACELCPQAGQDGIAPWYLKRSIVFGPGRIDAHFTTFADPDCSAHLLKLKFGGDLNVLGASDVAPGAREVDLNVNDYLTVTPQIEDFAAFLNSAEAGTCGSAEWSVGVEQDVFETGCAVMDVAANAPTTEYEVLFVSAGHLYFGARPVDGLPLAQPDDRPTALQMPLKRLEGGSTQRMICAFPNMSRLSCSNKPRVPTQPKCAFFLRPSPKR